ncbi:uncharacterized protein [Chelonus insularis]|uniref:uncharacterized protein n=1 Tax=Chelonus insularis TaxID=460826 RepID=UPI00158A1F63|nr:uncharacterized protein LOC118066772 [Chelonus insularis]
MLVSRMYLFIFTVFILCSVPPSIRADKVCDKSQCQGPVRYYEYLGCTPVYATPDNCCPYKYNCDHLQNRLPNKCYVGNREYEVDEVLQEEDAEPCDMDCKCQLILDKARLICRIAACSYQKLEPGCYFRTEAKKCCPVLVCPKDGEKRPECIVDGKTYNDSEKFILLSDPEKLCFCGPEYTAETADLFCRKKHYACDIHLQHPYDDKCAPTFFTSQSPSADCPYFNRCQNERDIVIKKFRANENPNGPDDMICKFGNLIMKYGDELVQNTYLDSICMNCTCEVGPIPTCQRLPKAICNPRNVKLSNS